ncbi:MAG: putative Ig domain-containing protein [Pirellulaceae bacterium]
MHRRPLRCELLEARTLLATFADANNNDSVSTAQVLYNDTSYTVNGRISTHGDLDFFTFYAEAGDNITATARAVFNGAPPEPEQQFDPMVAIYDPSGSLAQQDDDGGGTEAVPWTAVSTYLVTETGFWTVAVTDYPDFGFDGSAGEGPGLNTGKYRLTIEGVSTLEIEDADVTAQYDRSGNGETTFGTYLPHVSLDNEFTVDLGVTLPDAFAVQYQFGGLDSAFANRSGEQFTFVKDMGRLRPEQPSLTVELVHTPSGSILDTYLANVLFVKDLAYELEFDGVQAERLRLIGSEIAEGSWPVKATLPTNIDFFGQYKSEDLRLEVKSRNGGSRTTTTLTAQGDGTYTGTYNVGALVDTVKDGRDYDFGLVGTLVTGTPKPFTEPVDLLVVSYPDWLKDFTPTAATYSGGDYNITLNFGWERSVDPAKVDPFGLVKGKQSGVALDIGIQVIASRDLDADPEPKAELKNASMTAMLLGQEKANYALKDNVKIESTLDNETLDIESLRIFNDPKSPLQIVSNFFPAYNQTFALPSYLQKFGKLGIGANLNVAAQSGPITANVSLELAKVGNSVQWKGSGTYVELMASATGSVSIGANFSLLSVGGKGLVGVDVEGSMLVGLGAKARFEAAGELLNPSTSLNDAESGATLGLSWQILAKGTAFFGLFKVGEHTFKSNGVETYQLLGSYKHDITSMIKTGTGVSSGGGSGNSSESSDSNTSASGSASAYRLGALSSPTLQGTLRHLEVIPPSISNVSVQVQSFADRANVTAGLHRLDVVLVGLSSEVHLGSFDPADQTHQTDAHPLGFAAPAVDAAFPIDSEMVDPNEIYQLEFRYFKDGDAGGEVVEYEVHDVQLAIPQTDFTLTSPLGSLDDAALTFGPETGQSPVGSLLLTNSSTVDLTLASAEIVGNGFELLTPIAGPIFVQAGHAVVLDIRLLDATRAANAVLRIESNAPSKETFEVALEYDPAAPVDATVPEILATNLRGSTWGAVFPSLPLSNRLGAYGNLDQIEVVFSEDVDVESIDVRMIDENGAVLPASAFHFDANTDTATWTLAAPLTAGRYLLEWVNPVHDTAGNPLASVEPTEISIVPGDANDDGSTNFQDFVVVSNNFGQNSNGAGEGDFNGDGVTNFADFVILSNNFGTDQSELAQPNHAPVFDPLPNQAMVEGSTLNLAATASDANLLDTLEFSLVEGPDGATIDPVSGAFEYTAPSGIGISQYPITVRVTDDGQPARWAEQSFLILATPVNLPPVLDPIAAQAVEQGGQLLYRATASDGNDPLDTLVFSLDEAPEGAEIDSDTGMISWSPDFNVPAGDVTFTVRVTDSFSPAMSDTKSFTATVSQFNLPPTLDPVASQTGREGELIAFTATATDPNVGTIFTYSLGDSAPTGAVIDPATGDFTWTPAEDQDAGNFLVTVVVTDNGAPARSDDVQVAIQVDEVNAAPVLGTIGAQSVEAGQKLLFTATATDDDLPENNLTFSLDTGAPEGASIDPVTGVFQWTPGFDDVGTFIVTIRVSDDGAVALDDFETIAVEVTETQPPQISAFMTEAFRDENVASVASVSGSVVDSSPVTEFRAGFGDTPTESYVDILSDLNLEDEFLLDESRLDAINGAPLGEGTHTLHFRAVDANGNAANFDYVFQLDFTPPTLTLDLDPAFDSAPLGDLQTHYDVVSIVGQTEPFASVYLDDDLSEAVADAQGVIRWDNVRLELGSSTFSPWVTDLAGNTYGVDITITRITDGGCVGPDLFGYQACVVTPAFTDISSTGTAVLIGADQDYVELGPTELPEFQFHFYGVAVDHLFISSDGLITFDQGFTDYYQGTWGGDQLVHSPEGAAIAPLWDNLEVSGAASSSVYWELIGATGTRQLIVQWQDVTVSFNSGTATFQAVLNEADHSIQFNYLDLDGVSINDLPLESTVGIKPQGTSLPPVLRLAYGSAPNDLVGTGTSTLISLINQDSFVGMAIDAGDDPYDGLTNDPAIADGVFASYSIAVQRAGLNGTSEARFMDIRADLQPNRTFPLDTARLEQINGGPLDDGLHTLSTGFAQGDAGPSADYERLVDIVLEEADSETLGLYDDLEIAFDPIEE